MRQDSGISIREVPMMSSQRQQPPDGYDKSQSADQSATKNPQQPQTARPQNSYGPVLPDRPPAILRQGLIGNSSHGTAKVQLKVHPLTAAERAGTIRDSHAPPQQLHGQGGAYAKEQGIQRDSAVNGIQAPPRQQTGEAASSQPPAAAHQTASPHLQLQGLRAPSGLGGGHLRPAGASGQLKQSVGSQQPSGPEPGPQYSTDAQRPGQTASAPQQQQLRQVSSLNQPNAPGIGQQGSFQLPTSRSGAEAADGLPVAAEVSVPARLPVICNGNRGVFLVDRRVIICLCALCEVKASELGRAELELSPTDFERHSGSCTSKKWKYTVKVLEQTAYGSYPGMSVGMWLEKYVPTMTKSRGKVLGYSSIFGDVAPQQPKALARRASSKPKKRPQAEDRWKGRGAVGISRPGPGGSSSPGRDQADAEDENFMNHSTEFDGEGAEAPVAGVTDAGLTSPSGKKWLTAADTPNQAPLPKPAMREGPEFQATIPLLSGARPQGKEEDDPKAGLPGPSGLEALALAAGYEKSSSDALHIDAVADPEYHPGAAYDVRNLMVERGQRTRRKPRWLNNTIDPEAAPRAKHPTFPESYSDTDEMEDDPLSWKARPAKRNLQQEIRDGDRKRMRPLNNLYSRPTEARSSLARQDSLAPRVLQWDLLSDGFMRVTMLHHGQVYAGAIMQQPRDHKVESMGGYGKQAVSLNSGGDSGSESGGWGVSRAAADSRPSSGWNHERNDVDVTGTSDGHEVESYRGDPALQHQRSAPRTTPAAQPKTNPNRRALANRDYERMQADGPTEHARCALCHQPADPEAKEVSRTEEGGDNVNFDDLERKEEGLGPFLLVRVSAIMNAWVHMQCALWSPEVYVNNNGSVERTSEAVRRGRMIKCKLCGEKGATLGCHKRSCRASFHLSCAREHGCLLQGIADEPYLVTCKEHSEIRDEMELVPLMPVMPDQKVRVSPTDFPTRPRNIRTEVSGSCLPDLQPSSSGRGSGWSSLPKMATSLDTLSAAALAAKSSNLETAANPLAAQHFGGTVGQSVLRPGRCAVCVVQRKGVCGTQTAPKKCLRRIALVAAGREIPDAPPGWRTRRPVAHWPAAPRNRLNRRRSTSPASGTPGSQYSHQPLDREGSFAYSGGTSAQD